MQQGAVMERVNDNMKLKMVLTEISLRKQNEQYFMSPKPTT